MPAAHSTIRSGSILHSIDALVCESHLQAIGAVCCGAAVVRPAQPVLIAQQRCLTISAASCWTINTAKKDVFVFAVISTHHANK